MDPDFTFKNPADGQVIQGDATDVGKPLGFLPSGLLGVLVGAAVAVTAPLQAAITAAAAGAVLAVPQASYAAEGTLTITKNISLQLIGVDNTNGFTTAGITVSNGLIVAIEGASIGGPLTLGTGGTLNAVACVIASVAGAGSLTLYRSTVVGALVAKTVTATDSVIVGNVTISDVVAICDDTTFVGATVVTFSGAPGVLHLNGSSYINFFAAGGTVVNGTVVSDTFLAQGILTLIGVTSVPVAVATISANNFVMLTLSDPNGGTVGVNPRVIITPGVGFAVTAAALDTSKYFYRVI